MGAKIILTGTPKNVVHTKQNTVKFTIITGPAVNNSPKGLDLYGTILYQVECSNRQWRRGRFNDKDESDLIIEGYQEPRLTDNEKLYIAVVGMSVQSIRLQKERKFAQLTEEFERAAKEFALGRKRENTPKAKLEQLAGILVKARDNLNTFKERNPELTGDSK